jgi:hypothetical protein
VFGRGHEQFAPDLIPILSRQMIKLDHASILPAQVGPVVACACHLTEGNGESPAFNRRESESDVERHPVLYQEQAFNKIGVPA